MFHFNCLDYLIVLIINQKNHFAAYDTDQKPIQLIMKRIDYLILDSVKEFYASAQCVSTNVN